MDKEQIKKYFQLAPVVKQILSSNKELDEVEYMILEGYYALENEYDRFFKDINK